MLTQTKNSEKIIEYDVNKNVDLFWAVSNLISIEEHLGQSYARTEKEMYEKLLNEIRIIRAKHLDSLIVNKEAESWCISKHLLSSFMRLTEMATKELYDKNNKKFKEYIQDAFSLYDTFFILQKIEEIKKPVIPKERKKIVRKREKKVIKKTPKKAPKTFEKKSDKDIFLEDIDENTI